MLSYIIDVYVDTALKNTSVLMLEGLWGAVGEKSTGWRLTGVSKGGNTNNDRREDSGAVSRLNKEGRD
jgi:hypothetical protein